MTASLVYYVVYFNINFSFLPPVVALRVVTAESFFLQRVLWCRLSTVLPESMY